MICFNLFMFNIFPAISCGSLVATANKARKDGDNGVVSIIIIIILTTLILSGQFDNYSFFDHRSQSAKGVVNIIIASGLLDNWGWSRSIIICNSCRSSLFFLGFEFRYIASKFTWNRNKYTDVRPSMKSRSKLFCKLRELLSKRRHWRMEWIVWKINRLLIGWLNYFSISKVTHVWETVKIIKLHLSYKLFKWMKSKGRKAHRKLRQRPYENLVKSYGLLDIEKYARLKTLAKAE
ncbi:group II intron maturase-specific domain-containing protein [Chondrinema litorale]|uniref:group II intron maturase-specific domain-containing protein n=1 Tax=Chondrinema litorale TaxID=2994555 RepID=UPI0032B3FCFA